MRAQYFPQAGDRGWQDACLREVRAVRERVGLCDVSTLGKIEVVGADAAAFLDRLYTGMMSTLPVGRARYGLMLREDGFVMDDGTVARLDVERYVLSTTTANAVKVMGHMEFAAQVLWPHLDVACASVTEQWAQFAIAGPRSRDVVAAVLRSGFDLSNEAFPFMAAAATTLSNGTPARLFRVSFSGELAYELAVPAGYADGLARALMQAGAPHGIAPYGLEALSVLRIEKGHAAGGELNGQTTAADLGPRQDDVHQEGFHRRRHGQPSRPGRPRTPEPRRLQAGQWFRSDRRRRPSAAPRGREQGAQRRRTHHLRSRLADARPDCARPAPARAAADRGARQGL